MTPMLGKITLFPYDFEPRGWMFCDGRLLAIGDNDALFMLLGTTFGGDGEVTFALPDLRPITPPNCHYCIAVDGEFSVMRYDGLVGETLLLPFQSQAVDLLECTGQSVAKSKYPLLSVLMGTRFGGDSANFNLPDLRSKTPTNFRSVMAMQGFDPNHGGGPRSLYVGELVLLPYDSVEGLVLCAGAKMPIQGNDALFALLGKRFGGDDRQFAVPDLRANAPAKFNYFLARTGVFPSRGSGPA